MPGAIWHSFAEAAGSRLDLPPYPLGCGCSSGVEHDLAKVGVEGSNPFARSSFSPDSNGMADACKAHWANVPGNDASVMSLRTTTLGATSEFSGVGVGPIHDPRTMTVGMVMLTIAEANFSSQPASFRGRSLSPTVPRTAILPLTDEALIKAVARGERHAMELLYARHNVRVYRFVLRVSGNAAMAEDLVSEVFLDVWRHADGFKGQSRFPRGCSPSPETRRFRR